MATPAKARRTGNPSPSSPDGASLTPATGRNSFDASGTGIRGKARLSGTVTAGIEASLRHDFSVTTFLVATSLSNTPGARSVPTPSQEGVQPQHARWEVRRVHTRPLPRLPCERHRGRRKLPLALRYEPASLATTGAKTSTKWWGTST